MKNILFFAVLFLIVVFQATLFYEFNFFGISPNLVLVLVILFSFWISDVKKLLAIVLFLSSIISVFSGLPFAVILFSFITLFFIINLFLSRFIPRDNYFIMFAFVVFGTYIYYLLIVIFMGVFNLLDLTVYRITLDFVLFKSMLQESVYNLVVALLVFYIKERKFIYNLNIFK